MVEFRTRTGMFALIAFAVIAARFLPSPIIPAGPSGESPLAVASLLDVSPSFQIFEPSPSVVFQAEDLRVEEEQVYYVSNPYRLGSRAADVEGFDSAARVVASTNRTPTRAGLADFSTNLRQVPNGQSVDLRASDLGI